jgi:hypothetical protein
MVATMRRVLAGGPLFFDVGDLAIRRDLTVPSGDTPAPERTETQKANETHHAGPHSWAEQFLYR